MTWRSAPALYLVLVLISLSSGTRSNAGGRDVDQLRIKREILDTEDNLDPNENLINKRSALDESLDSQGKHFIKTDKPELNFDSTFPHGRDGKGANTNRYRQKRSPNNNVAESDQKIGAAQVHQNVERKSIPKELFPETVIHNLEQTSDKVESDMVERKSKIPDRITRDTHADKAVYELGEELSVEVPLTTNVHEREERSEGITKRNVAGEQADILDSEDQEGLKRSVKAQVVKTEAKLRKESGPSSWNKLITMKENSTTRRDEVPLPGANVIGNGLDDTDANDDFQVRDKSADLEIHADSTGVKVKAKPASLQVVSKPHGLLKSLPGETHVQGVTAERRTFTPLVPEEAKRRKHRYHRHHRFYHGFGDGLYPFLGRRHFHHHHRHHRLPWLRHRQHINYPDIFERMRDLNPLPEVPSAFNPSPSMGSPFPINPPMPSSIMNSPSMIPERGEGMSPMMGGTGMNNAMMPSLLQRSPTMETNPANRFGVPESPLGGIPQMSPMGGMGSMEHTEPFGGSMGQMMNSMPGMSPMSSGPDQMPRKNALEFWGMPNQDQLKALARGEDFRKVLGTNEYGENLGGITGGMMGEMNGGFLRGMQSGPGLGMGGGMGMKMPEGLSTGMGGPSFNANGMGNDGMMEPFGLSGTSGAMLNGMPNGQPGMMDNAMRRTALFKKDDINKTEDYKKAMKNKKSKTKDGKESSSSQGVVHKTAKFGERILNKAKSMMAGGKHVAKNEHAPLLREHRIRKSSKSSHDEEKRSLHKPEHAKKDSVKATVQKSKNVKGSKKDVAVQRPPIIYHPPPEIYHRPDIVVHRAPVLFQRPPIVYHQPPVVIHRPAVVYRQSPIIFHQPYPVVNQPYFRAWDNFVTHPMMSLVGSNVAQTYNYLGVPPEVAGYKKEQVPAKPGKSSNTSGKSEKNEKKNKRGSIPRQTKKEKDADDKNKVPQKKKKDVVVNRPPIIYHPPPEVYHRPEIVVHRAPLLIRRPPIVYHQPAVIVHRPPVVYHQPPIVFHQPPPTVNQPVLYSHDNFVVHPSFFATHRGSVVSDAGQLLGIPNTVSVPDAGGFPYEPAGVRPGGFAPGGMVPGGMAPIVPMGRKKRSTEGKKKGKHEKAKRKNAILVKRPPIVYHPPPEVYHRPDIVVHRAPIVIHRGPVVYHQPPVVVHRPAVMYHQPPLLFHQPPSLVHQPMFTAHDQYTPHTTLSLLSSSIAIGKSSLPKKARNTKKTTSKSSKRSENANETKQDGITKIAKEKLSTHDAKILANFLSQKALEKLSTRQLVSIMKDRKNGKNVLKPIIHDSNLKDLAIKQLTLVEDFLDDQKVDLQTLLEFCSEPTVLDLKMKRVGAALKKVVQIMKKSHTEEKPASKKGEIVKSNDEKKPAKKNAVLVKRPPIVYHPPPEVYHRPDIVVHRAPLFIHRAPIVYHQPPVVVHRPAVVYHQPPVLFHQPPPMVRQPVYAAHDVYHETTTLSPGSSTVTNHGAYVGVPTELITHGAAYGKSKVPASKDKKHSKKDRRSVSKKDKTVKASKKNAVLVKRPPIIYHPPPEVYHRPDIVVHRAPIVIHRAPLVYHQPPVIVHRPAVVYHQPAVVFHQPPPVVHQPMFASHDTFTPHDSLTLGGTSTTKVGDYLGPPPETYATRKGKVPRNKDVPGVHRDTIEKDRSKAKHQSKEKKRSPSRRSQLRKLILSLQKDHSSKNSERSLQAIIAPSNPLVLQRPPIFLQRTSPLVMNQPMVAPMVQRVLTPVPVVQQVIRPVAVPVVYHHHHWPVHVHHHHLQPVVVANHPVPIAVPHVHYTTYYHTPYHRQFGVQYTPYFGMSFVPKKTKNSKHSKKTRIDVHDFGVPVHGHVGHINGHSHVVKHHGFVTQYADCPVHCGSCYPYCPSDCKPQCVIIHHQHHRPHHVFVDHQHHHDIAQTHLHQHHWPVHHYDVHHGYPYFIYRHIGHGHPSYQRRDVNENSEDKTTVPHYAVYQHVKHWHPPCLHHDQVCHHHHHPTTIYHDHHHPANIYHHHHYHPYPVYHHHEHIKPVIYHHVKPYPVHHHHEHHIHDTWHHDHHHDYFHPPVPYPVPVEVPSPPEPYPVPFPLVHPYPVPVAQPYPVPHSHVHAHIIGRSHVPKATKETKKSETSRKPSEKKRKNKKKDVVVSRPPIIYHPPPEVYHRPEIVVHRAPVLIHRPPIVYHQSSVIVHRPAVVYHQPPIVFHQPPPTVNQPVLYSHDNFVVHPGMYATHAGTMVESAGHFLGLPTGPISNFPELSPYGPMGGFNTAFRGTSSYATPLGRRRRSTKSSSKKLDRKNSIVVHRPPVIYHPPPEIYHRPSVVLHRPDVLIHRPPIVYHQSPVVLHRPPVVYHQTPIVFHQPPPMVNQPVFHSHDAYVPHPVLTHYDSDIHHAGSFFGVPHYGEVYHGFHGGFGGYRGGFGGYHGGFDGFHGGFHGFGGGFGGAFGPGFGRSKVEKTEDKKKSTDEKDHRIRRDEKSRTKKQPRNSPGEKKRSKSERAGRKNSVVVNRPPMVFHPAPEVYHRPAYVLRQPDIVIHRPPVVYHQPPVVVHHPPVAYHQPPVVFHQHHPVIVTPTYHHHQFFSCVHSADPCFGSGLYGGFGHGFHGGFHGFPFLYGKSIVSKPKHSKKRKHSHANSAKGSKKHDIIIHRPPLVYHPPPEIYHRPDIIVHRPDVLVHRPSVVYDQPAVVLHRPAVVYHEPPVVFHQPPPMVHLPVYHAEDAYAPHPVYTQAGSHVDYHHNFVGVPQHFSFGLGHGFAHAFGKSKIEKHTKKHKKGTKKSLKKHHKKSSGTKNAHKKYHLMVHRPPILYHPPPTIYHRPDVVVHRPDIVIHRPSIVMHPSSIIVHKPAVLYHEPPVVFHQPPPAVHQPLYHSHDAYAPHPVYTHVGSELEHEGDYAGYAHSHYGDFHGDYHGGYYHDVGFGFGGHGHPYGGLEFPGFGKSQILKSKNGKLGSKQNKKNDVEEKGTGKETSEKEKREATSEKSKRVQFPQVQKEKTETGTKKNAILVRRPPIVYHPPPEVYHRPDIVVHRAPIVIQRAPLVYHQAPVIVHRPAVVYHQPAVVFHQPPPTVHQPVFHSLDNFDVHPHLRFSQAASSVQQVGNYIGIPDQVMHRSNIARNNGKPITPKQRRAVFEKNITPVTPLNFFHRSQTTFEQPRSTIPYPSLHALHPYLLSYSSFPWGVSPRYKRFVGGLPHALTPYSSPLPFGPQFTRPFPPFALHGPHVNVNVETIKSKVPRLRRQLPGSLDATAPAPYPEPSPIMTPPYLHPTMHYDQVSPFPPLSRPHVNVNVETIKSSVPPPEIRSRRQVLTGLPLGETQTSVAPPPTYSQPIAPLSSAPFPVAPIENSDEPVGVYRDLLGALYGSRGTKRRPKVNIVVQTSKSKIPTPGEESTDRKFVPRSLKKENIDAFNTMPEVTTIEPPLLRDGVRVNMVDLGDPTVGNDPAQRAVSSQLPLANVQNMQRYGNMMGRGGQGDFGIDKWKKSVINGEFYGKSQVKSTISVPNMMWKDENAEKKSSVPAANREAVARKRYEVGGFQNPEELPNYQTVPETQGPSEVEKLRESVSSGDMNSYGSDFQSVTGPQVDSGLQTVDGSQPDSSPQPGRGHINVNIETVKNVLPKTPKRRTLDVIMPHKKRQLIGTVPLVSLVQPTPNNVRPLVKSTVPTQAAQYKNTARPVSKRQEVMGRLPMMQVVPQLRHAVSSLPASRPKPQRRYPAFPVQDDQPALQVAQGPSELALQGIQPAQQFQSPATITADVPRSQSYFEPSSAVSAEPAMHMTAPVPYQDALGSLYPWGSHPRPHVDVNVETTKSKIPNRISRRIVTPRFKRDYPVLYHVIKAKVKDTKGKREAIKRRGKRQIPFYAPGNFFESLIPDPNVLAKRAFYDSVPSYPVYPSELYPRAFRRPRPANSPQKVSLGNMGAIEVGGDGGASSLPNAASLLRNEFSQNFDDIAKIQRQEVNAIKGMNSMNTPPATQVVTVPHEQGRSAFRLEGGPAVSAAETPAITPLQDQPQQTQPIAMPFTAQQSPQILNPAPQTIPAQPTTSQFAAQPLPQASTGVVRAKSLENLPATQAADTATSIPKSSFVEETPLPGQVPGFPPGFSFPGVQFIPVPAAELPLLQYPPRPFLNSIPRFPEATNSDEEDRPSVKIQVQTSKSSIPKIKKKKPKKKTQS